MEKSNRHFRITESCRAVRGSMRGVGEWASEGGPSVASRVGSDGCDRYIADVYLYV